MGRRGNCLPCVLNHTLIGLFYICSLLLLPEQIEYTLVTLDCEKEEARLSLVGPDILDTLQKPEYNDPLHHMTKWRPEYASYMIEGQLHHGCYPEYHIHCNSSTSSSKCTYGQRHFNYSDYGNCPS